MVLVARDAHAYVAVPVFRSRPFRHSPIYIRADRGIDRPKDLTGKVIGVTEYPMAAAVWILAFCRTTTGCVPRMYNGAAANSSNPAARRGSP